MQESERVSPRTFRGMRDLLPQEMAARQWMIDRIRHVYELYGFLPLETPGVEYLDVLTGSAGSEAAASLFRVRNPDDPLDKSHSDRLGLRFDLTVPLARVISQYYDLPRPFRRYQVSPVWRADKPGPGRFREFVQFDLDSVAVDNEVADVEIVAAMADTLTELKAGSYLVKFSSRGVLNLVLPFAGIPARETYIQRAKDGSELKTIERTGADVFRVLDKLDKLGSEKVRLELTIGYIDESGDWIPGLGLNSHQVDRIEQFVAIKPEKRVDVLRQVSDLFANVPNVDREINVLTNMSRRLAMLGYHEDRVVIDLSVARGLAYYTGPVFEAVLLDAPQFGSVFGGGRYDELVLRFSGQRVPATGASIGVDRLLAALIHLKRAPLKMATAKTLVAVVEQGMMDDYLAITYEFRRNGIPTELYLGNEKLGKQFKYADVQGIPFVVIYGSDEKARGVITIKDMRKGKQQSAQIPDHATWKQLRPGQIEVARTGMVEAVKAMISTGQADA